MKNKRILQLLLVSLLLSGCDFATSLFKKDSHENQNQSQVIVDDDNNTDNEEKEEEETEKKTETVVLNGVEVNNFPFVLNELSFENISVVGDYISFEIKNISLDPLSTSSYFNYKEFDRSGIVIDTSHCYLEAIDPNEICISTFSLSKRTTKLLITSIYASKGYTSEHILTDTCNGLITNACPFGDDNIVLDSLSYNQNKLNGVFINNNDSAISSSSKYYYKFYDKNGYVVDSGWNYLEPLFKGEKCRLNLSIPKDLSKAIIYCIKKSTDVEPIDYKLSDYGNYIANQIPLTIKSLTITDIIFENNKARITVRNDSEFSLSSLTNLYYKTYDNEGFVIDMSYLYLDELSPTEQCTVEISLFSDFKKLYIYSCSISKLTESPINPTDYETQLVENYYVNKLTYTIGNLSIEAISFNNYYAFVTISNNGDSTISSNSRIYYCLFDDNDNFISQNISYLYKLNPNEKMIKKISISSQVKKIIFYKANVSYCDAIATVPTELNGNFYTNITPYSLNNLKIESIDFIDYKLYFTISNQTGSNITKSSKLYYRCYNSDGYVIDDDYVYLVELDFNESYMGNFSFDNKSVKIVFYDSVISTK